jgi:hypothetical protein
MARINLLLNRAAPVSKRAPLVRRALASISPILPGGIPVFIILRGADRSIGATFQALPGASFVVNGASMAANSALVTGSAEMKWRNGWSAAATFEGEFSGRNQGFDRIINPPFPMPSLALTPIQGTRRGRSTDSEGRAK